MNRVQGVIGGFFCLIMGTISWYSYCYFFDYSSPIIEIIGLQQGSVYQGDIVGKIVIKDSYKIQELSIFFDDAPFCDTLKQNIGKKEYECPFELATKTLSDGKHSLKIEASDSSYNNNKSAYEISFIVDNQPLYVAFTKTEYEHNKVLQGRTLHVQFRVSKEIERAQITFLSHTYEAFLESLQSKVYEAFIPIICEENPGEYPFVIDIFDKVGNTVVLESKVQVVAYPFKKQKIAVNPEKSKKESENGFLQDEFEKIMQKLLVQSPKKKLWQGKFCAPTDIKNISTEFGVQRVSQERGQYIHQGIDIINDSKFCSMGLSSRHCCCKRSLCNKWQHCGNRSWLWYFFSFLSS